MSFTLVYESDNDPEYFEIVQDPNDNKRASLLTLEQFSRDEDERLSDYVPLDNTIKYKVNVLAEDQGARPLSTTCFFFVTITDINNNDPIFDSSSYEVTIQKSPAINTQVEK